jgi:hypothetical protein
MGPEVELYYMRNRWYEPQTGRFLSEDPIGLAGGINPYAFAGLDPVSGRDPTGLCHEPGKWYNHDNPDGPPCFVLSMDPINVVAFGPAWFGNDPAETDDPSQPSGESVTAAAGHGSSPTPAENACTTGAGLALIGTAILDASFFFGVFEAKVLARTGVLVARESRALWRAGNVMGAVQSGVLSRWAVRDASAGLAGQAGWQAFSDGASASMSLMNGTTQGFGGFLLDFIPGVATGKALVQYAHACF